MLKKILAKIGERFSPGVIVLLTIAGLSSILVGMREVESEDGEIIVWTFARHHLDGYQPLIDEWNQAVESGGGKFKHARRKARMIVKDADTIRRQMLSGFLADVPTAEILIMEGRIAPSAWSGPMEAAGLYDLTPLIEEDGLDELINTPSFSHWSFRGRKFGLPHDVHPMMLVYRADIVEAAGIDVSQVETWDDWFTLLRPLVQDLDGDGGVDRYLLGIDDVIFTSLDCLYLQAGGSFFDREGKPSFREPTLARVIAKCVQWLSQPDAVATLVPWQSGTRNRMFIEGYTIAWLCPDWGTAAIEREISQLSGKLKLMPMPAWTPGGRRTSVLGGTMSGITKAHSPTKELRDEVWELQKHLIMNRNAAINQFKKFQVVSPRKDYWEDPVYDQPDPYFSNQPIGRMFIELAPDVPERTSSPYAVFAKQRCADALSRLLRWAEKTGTHDLDELEAKAMEFIDDAYEQTLTQIRRNPFYAASEVMEN